MRTRHRRLSCLISPPALNFALGWRYPSEPKRNPAPRRSLPLTPQPTIQEEVSSYKNASSNRLQVNHWSLSFKTEYAVVDAAIPRPKAKELQGKEICRS